MDGNDGGNGAVALEKQHSAGFALSHVVDEAEAFGFEGRYAYGGLLVVAGGHRWGSYMVHFTWTMFERQEETAPSQVSEAKPGVPGGWRFLSSPD